MKERYDYILKQNDFIKKMDSYYKEQATKKLSQIKSNLPLYIYILSAALMII